MERKSRAQFESATFIVIVVVALVLVNLLSVRFFVRKDLTNRHLFTLSDGTARIVRGLHDQLTVRVYWSNNQPATHASDERTVRDQLEEYRTLNRDRVRVQWISPGTADNDTDRRRAEDDGCHRHVMQDAREDQATAARGYRCIAFEYLGRKDRIDNLPRGVQGLEFDVSSIIRQLTLPQAQRQRTIGFLTGHGEMTPDQELQYLTQPQLRQIVHISYEMRTVNLNSGENEVPRDIAGLVIVNPTQQISEREQRQLDAYLMRGGAVAIFAGGLNMATTNPMNATGTASEHHLNEWLDGYGLHINTDAVLDLRSDDAVIPWENEQVQLRLMTWPVIQAYEDGAPSASEMNRLGGLDPSFAVVFRLPHFVATYPSSIRVDERRVRAGGGTLHVFARTSENSIARTSNYEFDLQELLFTPEGRRVFQDPTYRAAHSYARNGGPFTVGVAVEGRLRSAFHDRPHQPASGQVAVSPPSAAEHPARVMVVSSGSMLGVESLRMMPRPPGARLPINIYMLLNTFDWLSQDLDLLAVRAKDTSDPRLRRDISEWKRTVFKIGTIGVLPISIGLLGVAILFARRSRRRRYLTDYRPDPGAKS
jgi:ABC-type uncharacterized transport system involved in gliding motility auxiliary subunit